VAWSALNTRPCARVSASSASKSRMPLSGSRTLSQPSNSALLSLVCCPRKRKGPYTHNTPGAARQPPTPRTNSRTALQAMMCSVLALNTASTGATRQGCSRASSAMGARRLDVPSRRMRSASGPSCSASSLLRTSRIGSLLRSQASDSVSMARVCDNTPMQAIDALLQRRSARELTEPAPDEGALELIFSGAVRAPDHGRLRPWRFVVVRGSARERLGELFADHALRAQPQLGAQALQRERLKALRAPLIVAVAAHCNPSVKIPLIEQTLSAGAAAHAMMLAAFALGFNAMWKTGGPAYDETVKQALGFASTDDIVGFLYLGTETAPTAPPARSEWRDLVRYWGEQDTAV